MATRAPFTKLEHLSATEVAARVDWVILNGYLDLEYDGKLPLLIYTQRGWAMERESLVREILCKMEESLTAGQAMDMSILKDRNREVIDLVIDRLDAMNDKRYIPVLAAWEQDTYKKLRPRIRAVIEKLSGVGLQS